MGGGLVMRSPARLTESESGELFRWIGVFLWGELCAVMITSRKADVDIS